MLGTKVSHYDIQEKLGEGGMGAVYKARDTRLDRLVALKFLPPFAGEEEQERFEREAKTISALNHPHIAVLYDIGQEKGQQYLVLEYLPGGTLKQLIPSLKQERTLELATQVAQGLVHAHRNGIIHRDIKPENILLTKEGSAKIVDFGLARLQGKSRLTKTGSTVGTLAYMSPEQLQGMATDHRTDIWAFGVMLFEMLTGELPFRGEHEAAIMYSVVNEQPPLEKLPLAFQSLVQKMLAKEPTKRTSSVNEVFNELLKIKERASQTLYAPVTPQQAAPSPTNVFQRLLQTRPLLYGLLTITVVALQIFVLPNLLQKNKGTDLAGYPSALLSGAPEEPKDEDFLSKDNSGGNDMYSTMIVMLRSMNKNDEVITVARKFAGTNPNNTSAWLTLALALELNKQYGEASAAYQRAVKIAPNNVDARVGLGRTDLVLKQFDDCRKNLETALTLDPNRKELPKLLWKLGDGLAQSQRYPEALPLYQKAMQMMGKQGGK